MSHNDAVEFLGDSPMEPDGVMKPFPNTWEWERRPGLIGHYRRSCCGATDDEKQHDTGCQHSNTPGNISVSSGDVQKVFGKQNTFVIRLVSTEAPSTPEARRIVREHGVMASSIEHFLKRNRGYGSGAADLGIRGQFADLNRKMLKLRRYVWDGEPVVEGEEDVTTILKELIGHCLLTLDMIDERGME